MLVKFNRALITFGGETHRRNEIAEVPDEEARQLLKRGDISLVPNEEAMDITDTLIVESAATDGDESDLVVADEDEE